MLHVSHKYLLSLPPTKLVSVFVVAVNLTIAPNLMSLVELDVNEHSNSPSSQTSPSQVSCATTNPPNSHTDDGASEFQTGPVSQSVANKKTSEESVKHDILEEQRRGYSSSPQLLTSTSHSVAVSQSDSDMGTTDKAVKFTIGSRTSIDTNASTNQSVTQGQGSYNILCLF